MTRYLSLALIAGVLAGSMQLSADEGISITVRPAVATARGNAQVKVIVARNVLNRALVWEVDGPTYYRSSAMELDGASSPKTYVFLVRDLPAGSFEVRASLRRTDESVVTVRSKILVVGGPNAD